jgi:ATP/maltotriose-dependent transcriptional regulator MalT
MTFPRRNQTMSLTRHIADRIADHIATRVIEHLRRHWAPPECPSPKPTEYEIMTAALDNLAAQVAANNDVVQSAVTLLSTLKSELDAALASDDTAALQALSDQLGTETSALASAVAANTPAEPAPPTDDTPPSDDATNG